MANCRNYLVLCFIIIPIDNSVQRDILDNLVKMSNIYYQQPLQNGKRNEFILDNINEMTIKTDIKVIVHGYLGNRFHTSIVPLRNAYMAQGKENVFLADWENAALLDYASSRGAVAKVGLYFAKKLEIFLNKHEIPPSELHIIGHSLGAHIAGNIGHYFNGSVGRVTGLDPALPLFTPNATDSLHSNAASFVDVIHTGYPVFGDNTPRGTVDFYPNYGQIPQKGCDDINLISASKIIFEAYSCSHNRAVVLYAESIGLPQNFPAIPCSLTAIQKRSNNLCLQEFRNDKKTKTSVAEAIATKKDDLIAYMGEAASKSAIGLFYLETYDEPPYGLGLYTQIH